MKASAEVGALKEHGDNALMLFVTCTGVPPHVIDSTEFRVFCSTLKANYKPPSATTLSDRLVRNECARIIKKWSTSFNLALCEVRANLPVNQTADPNSPNPSLVPIHSGAERTLSLWSDSLEPSHLTDRHCITFSSTAGHDGVYPL
ncbi:hypothetical protein AZE42_10236 [Rhizopogon vesiculosus]|uniref:Uncharacterized protein n=1 Tax=Rhizopogon vesiculosus TaxID=180088 RepID=A0A1J8Q0X6_9AGAM|nr:hypothetical protein AZE42_10236 [Rhizopogon vesiculosus]